MVDQEGARDEEAARARLRHGVRSIRRPGHHTRVDIWEPEEDEMTTSARVAAGYPRFVRLKQTLGGKRKRAREKLAEKEKENGNRAFRAQQYSEALRCYDIAVDNNKCNRQYLNNRAFAHIKLRGWASAIEDCDKALYIGEAFEGIGERKKPDTTTAKSYLRRALAHSGRGDPQRSRTSPTSSCAQRTKASRNSFDVLRQSWLNSKRRVVRADAQAQVEAGVAFAEVHDD